MNEMSSEYMLITLDDELPEMPEFEPHYLLIVDRKNNTDTMELQVEVRPEYYSDEINKMLALKNTGIPG